jgi:hypothetical protein
VIPAEVTARELQVLRAHRNITDYARVLTPYLL